MSSFNYSPSIFNPVNEDTLIREFRLRTKTVLLENNTFFKFALAKDLIYRIQPNLVRDKAYEFVKSLNWKLKYIRIRIIFCKTSGEIRVELIENSSSLIMNAVSQGIDSSESLGNNSNISLDQVIIIAQQKRESKTARTLNAKVKEVLGTCLSVGCQVNGENPRMILNRIENGYILIPELK